MPSSDFADVREKDQGNQESNIERYVSQARMRLQGIAGVLDDKMSQETTMIPTAIYTIWHTASILDCMTL